MNTQKHIAARTTMRLTLPAPKRTDLGGYGAMLALPQARDKGLNATAQRRLTCIVGRMIDTRATSQMRQDGRNRQRNNHLASFRNGHMIPSLFLKNPPRRVGSRQTLTLQGGTA